MMTALTGTPGTGKTTIAAIFTARGIPVVSQKETMGPHILEHDADRDTDIIDEDAWVDAFVPMEGIIEGHLTHLLPADRVVVLRCRPDILAARLRARGYSEEKVQENAEAEALDAILIETLEVHPEEQITVIDTTDQSPEQTADEIEAFIRGDAPHSLAVPDWSEYLGRRV
ncbi:adenylate kinase family protein [Methanogenium organophilum]|uniref:Putative adenylate kinase n=1 Tax=Methanogenium organophilum TaxID=2199 RepID=A0A9X9T949_METOG|nr:adenylate kinase family protein [Methanogenium organophilum]WAI02066.1 adenylate kinase family protein [Methanogenium organophilum]